MCERRVRADHAAPQPSIPMPKSHGGRRRVWGAGRLGRAEQVRMVRAGGVVHAGMVRAADASRAARRTSRHAMRAARRAWGAWGVAGRARRATRTGALGSFARGGGVCGQPGGGGGTRLAELTTSR